MSLHPLAQAHLARLAELNLMPIDQLTPQAARAQSRWQRAQLRPPLEAIHADAAHLRVDDRLIDGPAGPLEVRVYRPAAAGPWPGCMFFHGGGWVLGDLDAQDRECRMIAAEAACVVVSVNYRHAPEFRFPHAPEDCYAATAWVARHAAAFDIDPQRLVVAGLSAGANLAIATTLMARERKGPALLAQVLMVPVTHCSFETASYRLHAQGYDLSLRSMQWYWQQYLARAQDGRHPWASPLLAPDLSGLPPALLMVSQFDPLCDEGLAYAARLREQGVEVHTVFNEGMLHGFHGPQAMQEVVTYLRRQFA